MHRFRRLNLSIIVFWFQLFNYFNYRLIISYWPSSTWSRSVASTVFIRSAPLERLMRIVTNTVVSFQCVWRLFQHPEDCFYKWKQYSVNSWHIFVYSRAQHTHTIGFLIAAQYYYHHIACTVLQFKSILSSIISSGLAQLFSFDSWNLNPDVRKWGLWTFPLFSSRNRICIQMNQKKEEKRSVIKTVHTEFHWQKL